MGSVSPLRWERFVESLHFGEPCEFGEGDVGMPGAVQMTEPANSNVTTVDAARVLFAGGGGQCGGRAKLRERRVLRG